MFFVDVKIIANKLEKGFDNNLKWGCSEQGYAYLRNNERFIKRRGYRSLFYLYAESDLTLP